MNKWLVGIVIVVIVLGGVYVLRKQRGAMMRTNTLPTQAVAQSSTPPVSNSQKTTPSTAAVQQNTVTLTQDGFSPATLTIKVGTKVTWINKSGGDATVNSNPHPAHTNYTPLNLGGFSNGGTLSLTFNKAGTYGYHNHLSASQIGTIVVQ